MAHYNHKFQSLIMLKSYGDKNTIFKKAVHFINVLHLEGKKNKWITFAMSEKKIIHLNSDVGY